MDQGNRTGQTVTVNFPGEIDAVVVRYRNSADGCQDQRPFGLYAYVFRINSPKTVKSLTLPNNADVLALPATLLSDQCLIGCGASAGYEPRGPDLILINSKRNFPSARGESS